MMPPSKYDSSSEINTMLQSCIKVALQMKITSDEYNKKNLLVAAPSEARRLTLYEQCGSAYKIWSHLNNEFKVEK